MPSHRRLQRVAGLALVFFALGLGSCGRDDVFREEGPEALRAEALDFADTFLAALDRGAFADTWPMVATSIQLRTGEEAWMDGVRAARSAVGPVTERSLLRAGYRDTMADAPPGSYFVIEYDTTFGDTEAIERVVCFHEGAQEWRSAGYFVTTKP